MRLFITLVEQVEQGALEEPAVQEEQVVLEAQEAQEAQAVLGVLEALEAQEQQAQVE
jgi:hypothetical protein